jgi:hypothetical protein
MLGIMEEYDVFDSDLIIHINSALAILTQIGAGPAAGFSIQDADTVWNDFIPDDARLEFVKSYVYLKARLLFDPPLGTAVLEAMNRQVSELEWRIQVAAESAGG